MNRRFGSRIDADKMRLLCPACLAAVSAHSRLRSRMDIDPCNECARRLALDGGSPTADAMLVPGR